MHPETPHTVLTTKTCVAIGTHFYSFATTRETFFAMVAEHFNGRFITNVEHPRAPLLYLKAIDALYDTFCGIYGENCETLPSQWHSAFLFLHAFSTLANFIQGSLPLREEIIWAIVLINYLPEIFPDVPTDSIESVWHVSKEFKVDYKYAHERASKLWSWLNERVPDTEPSWNQLTNQIEIDAWRAIEYYRKTWKRPQRFQGSSM